ncbi:hypothetical protein [Arenivirga flava]|uniref:Uncharacterized protein n=1 Tax=Arenivirga flava TaxID=1930060 RepID=A0AA37XBU6_9MICO|nr:hypothetical protein [Arenivirga flava]GMA29146.1 hypothetical protein GCM10025874_23990 [Arenivirga flava]
MTTASARPPLPTVIGIGAAGMLLTGASVALLTLAWSSEETWLATARLALLFLGALLVSVAGGLLLVRRGDLRAGPAAVAAVAAVPAWTFGALATASWGIGMEEADAGGAGTWFGHATFAFLLAAWAFGAGACLPPALVAVRGLRSTALRLVLALVIAVPTSLTIGLLSAQGAGPLLGGAAVLLLATLQGRASSDPAPAAVHTAEIGVTAPLDRRQRRTVTAVAVGSAALGLGCVVLALAGSVLLPALGDATETMRLGILAGSIAAIPVVAAGAAALRPKLGRAVLPPAVAFTGALLALAAGYALDQAHPLASPALLLAAGLTGLGGALLLAPLLPGGRAVRAALVAAIAVALAASFGMLIMMAAFAAPLLGLLVALLANRRARTARSVGPAAATSG